MRAARALLVVLALGLLALALAVDRRGSNEPTPEPTLSVDQPALGVVLAGLCFVLVAAYRSHFAGVFAAKPQIG